MSMIKVGKKSQQVLPRGFVPVGAKWKVDDGRFKEHSNEEKTYRALMKAVSAHYVGKKPAELGKDNFQYGVKGPYFYIDKVDVTTAGKQTTYHAKGRAALYAMNMRTDSASEEIVAFELTFRDAVDEKKLPDIELLSGSVDKLPRGSTLAP